MQQAAIAYSPVMSILAKTIDDTKIDGQHWPEDAHFCASVRQRTWPLYSGDYRAHFFQTQTQLDVFMKDQLDWARLEDNYLDFIVYEWDLGPKVIDRY
jgi:hypothetical protein